jgi:hypothetical protein
LADLIRSSVDVLLAQPEQLDIAALGARAAAAVRFRSGRRDLASRHDRHLADAI